MKDYITGFNNGYLLAQYKPKLLAQIVNHISAISSDYVLGFFSGVEEFEFEKSKQQLNQLEQLRDRSKNRGRDLEKE